MSPLRATAVRNRHPDEFLLLLLCVIAGLGFTFGDVPEPDSLEAAVPGWAVGLWGWGLLIGPLVIAAGIFWRDRHDGVVIEQVGQIMTGGVAIFYGFVLLVSAWPASIVAGGITIAFGIARFWRWWQLQKLVNSAVQEASHGE